MPNYWILMEDWKMGSFKIFHNGELVHEIEGENFHLVDGWVMNYQVEHGGVIEIQYGPMIPYEGLDMVDDDKGIEIWHQDGG